MNFLRLNLFHYLEIKQNIHLYYKYFGIRAIWPHTLRFQLCLSLGSARRRANRGSAAHATQGLINLPNQRRGPRAFLLFSLRAARQRAI